jgi:hypothetical protein
MGLTQIQNALRAYWPGSQEPAAIWRLPVTEENDQSVSVGLTGFRSMGKGVAVG